MKNKLKNLKKLWSFIKKEKIRIIIFSIVTFILAIIYIIFPLYGAKRLTYLNTGLLDKLLYVSSFLFFLNILEAVFAFIKTKVSIIIQRNIFRDLQNTLGREILKLTTFTFDREGSSVFVQRMTSDLYKITNIYSQIIDTVSSIIKVIGVFVLLYTVNIYAAVYCTLFSIIIFIYTDKKTTILKSKDKEIREVSEKTTSFLNELIRGSKDVKVLNSEESFLITLDKKITEKFQLDAKKSNLRNVFDKITYVLLAIYSFLFCLLLIYLIKNQGLDIGVAVILYTYSPKVVSYNQFMARFLTYIKDFDLSCERVFSILDSKDFEKETWGNKKLNNIEGLIEFKDVSFKYKENDVLKNMNFKINPGETIAFVGKSGAGKTTIFNLICKLYNINKGEILLDGKNIYELDKDSLRGNISIITQNPYIFNLSIRDNFKLIKEDLTDKEMIIACKKACLHDFINSLPEKYDTVLGEGGVTLSGGQRQRLAIARAFIQNTKVILFDEATSALDNETQASIKETIDNMKGDFTILIVAHRLSTIKNADRILFIQDGKVLDSGNHKYLFNHCKEYRQLYNSEIITKED